jgi:hypothetical protein
MFADQFGLRIVHQLARHPAPAGDGGGIVGAAIEIEVAPDVEIYPIPSPPSALADGGFMNKRWQLDPNFARKRAEAVSP